MNRDSLKEILVKTAGRGGFEIPALILKEPACDLSLAIEIFYLCNGYGYFLNSNSGSEEWRKFISELYGRILSGEFSREDYHYEIPLTETQREQMRENNVPEIFLQDL